MDMSIEESIARKGLLLKNAAILNAMSVDVEDYFQVSAFDPYVERDKWDSFPGRVESNVDRILEIFDQHRVKATFFTLGWIAQKYPEMTRRIVEQGHELASHGWEHIRVIHQTREQFKVDVRRTKDFLEDISGVGISGYRAASYSINETNLWAHEILVEEGYQYSSSIAPFKHDLYGIPDAPRFMHERVDGRLIEIPVSTVRLGGKNLPCGGGGWFRLYPYALSRWAINRVNSKDKEACVFYFHPWEIDADQPRQSGLDSKTRFRHYLNLDMMEAKLQRLLNDFQWGRMDEVYQLMPKIEPTVAATIR